MLIFFDCIEVGELAIQRGVRPSTILAFNLSIAKLHRVHTVGFSRHGGKLLFVEWIG